VNRLLRPETAFFLIVWLVLLLAYRERGFYDPGALWHVRVGELILTTGFPHTDPFTYTHEGKVWIPQQWGGEVLMALAHRVGGFDTMLLGFATLVAGLFTAIFSRAVRSGMGPLLAGLVVGGALFVGAFHYFVRPHMFTIGFLGWTMMCVVDFERGRCGVARLAWLIPLYVVWTNLHGGVLGGTMTLGLAVAGWGVLFLWNRYAKPQTAWVTPITDWRTAFLLTGIVVSCGLTPFQNPFGMEMINTWRRIVGSKVLPQLVNEHMPLDPASPVGQAVIGFGVVYLVMLLGTIGTRPRVSWLVPLAWLVLSFQSIRQGPLFAITGVVALIAMWPHTRWHRLLVKHGDGSLAHDPEPDGPAGRCCFGWVAIPAVVVLLAFTLQLNRVPVPVVGHGWARLAPDFVPTDLTPELREYCASVPPGTRVFNDANLGGYLIYHAPELKIFMDDRCELYGDEWILNYAETLSLPPDELGPKFEAWAAEYRFERAYIAVAPPEQDRTSLELYLGGNPQRWREVARGKRAAVYERVK
jgi:hypothetical protein